MRKNAILIDKRKTSHGRNGPLYISGGVQAGRGRRPQQLPQLQPEDAGLGERQARVGDGGPDVGGLSAPRRVQVVVHLGDG